MQTLAPLDWMVIAVYFVAVFGVAIWVSLREKTRETSAGYFLAGRNVGWFVIGASLFASNIGSEHLVGLSGTGFDSGVAVGQFEVLASLILLLLGWVFVPFYIKSSVFTMPEFLERRYTPAARWYLAVVSVIAYVLTKISVTILAGGIVFNTLMGINFWVGAVIVVVATGIYTIVGGLRAVLYTDMLQMFVLIGGAIAVTVAGLMELGGWAQMREIAGGSYFDMWQPMTHPQFPWTGILFGAPILGVWYWCTDQYIVQRVLSAKNIDHARVGTLFAGYLKLLPVFLFVIPGVIAYCLVQTGRLEVAKPDEALPTLVGALLPIGLRGLVVAGLLAALMSSLSSVFNSCSTVVTWDLYKKLRPEASDRHLVVVGQIATVVLVVFGLLWIPLMGRVSQTLYTYLQSVQAYISPPVAAVFLFGIAWKRLNGAGAMAALLAGFVFGAARLILELNKDALGTSGVLFQLADMNFLHFAILLFAVCTVLLVVVSLATPPAPPSQLVGLTFQTVEPVTGQTAEMLATTRRMLTRHVGLSLLLVALVAAVWIYFSG